MSGWKWLDDGPLWRFILFVTLTPILVAVVANGIILWAVSS